MFCSKEVFIFIHKHVFKYKSENQTILLLKLQRKYRIGIGWNILKAEEKKIIL